MRINLEPLLLGVHWNVIKQELCYYTQTFLVSRENLIEKGVANK